MSALLAAWGWFAGTRGGRILMAFGAAIGALGWAWLAGRRAAEQRAAQDALRGDIDNRRIRDAVDRDVARDPDPGERLRRDWSRD
ncbi:MAG TPA: hypothetical protein VGM87_25115 [Roseomonas sp.]|jgi:hypothetical protein